MVHVRPAAVAGSFYPAAPAQLRADLDAMLSGVAAPQAAMPKALIVPHAGYIYSGPVAASAYVALRPAAQRIRRVVLLGPAHRAYVTGLTLPEVEAFETPLGTVPIDTAFAARIPWVSRST